MHYFAIHTTPLSLSAEPGYYEDGKFGVRIENVVQIVAAPTKVCMYSLSSFPVPEHSSFFVSIILERLNF